MEDETTRFPSCHCYSSRLTPTTELKLNRSRAILAYRFHVRLRFLFLFSFSLISPCYVSCSPILFHSFFVRKLYVDKIILIRLSVARSISANCGERTSHCRALRYRNKYRLMFYERIRSHHSPLTGTDNGIRSLTFALAVPLRLGTPVTNESFPIYSGMI